MTVESPPTTAALAAVPYEERIEAARRLISRDVVHDSSLEPIDRLDAAIELIRAAMFAGGRALVPGEEADPLAEMCHRAVCRACGFVWLSAIRPPKLDNGICPSGYGCRKEN